MGGGRRPGFVLSSDAVKRALLCSYPYDALTNDALCPTNWRSSDTCVPGCPSVANQFRVGALQASKPCRNVSNCKRIFACCRIPPLGKAWRRPRLSLTQTMLLHQSRVTNGTRPFKGESPAATLERARLAMQLQLNQYNELVLDADTLNYAAGGAIEAVYMLPRTALIDAQVSFAKARTQRIQHTWSAISKKLRLQQDQNLLARTVHSQLLCHFNWTAQQLPLLELDMSNPVEPFRRVP